MQQLEPGGAVRWGKLGVGVQMVTPEPPKSLGLAGIQGVLVNSVEPGGSAEHPGIPAGDVIAAVNGRRIEDTNGFKNIIATFAPRTEVGLNVLTGGKEHQVKACLAEVDPKANGKAGGSNRLGVTAEPMVPDMAPRLGLPSGIRGISVVTVDPQGPGARAGIQPDDVIWEVNHQRVASAADFSSALAKSASLVQLLINRRGLTLFLAIELPP